MPKRRAKTAKSKTRRVVRFKPMDVPERIPALQEILKWECNSDHSRRLVEWVAVAFLVSIGLIYSLHFLGHFVFPNPDFVAFLQVGKGWLAFQIPSSMKRAPLFSVITALVGYFFSTPDRNLFSTELYNAIMLPTVMVLIYFIDREFLDKATVWIALLACISP